MLQKRSLRKDYYKILGIQRDASTEEIKKAYRKRALVHHPGKLNSHYFIEKTDASSVHDIYPGYLTDRHANASEGEKKEQEKKFKELGEAYGILSDPNKRFRYDNGQDLDDSFSSESELEFFYCHESRFLISVIIECFLNFIHLFFRY